MPNYLVLLRHGQSTWNRENRFTGFKDVDLTEKGEAEAKRSGELLKKAGIEFDQVFTSTQLRANRTAEIALNEAGQGDALAAMIRHDDLRERDYGDLTGHTHTEICEKHGADQVHI